MSKSQHPRIRALLREDLDGLTAGEIADKLELKTDSVRNALLNMPDAYIDRWLAARQGKREEAVWCVVIPPENCPKPE
jgi:predicted ArsR family transcriptional regulator